MQALRYARTLRHLRPVQVWGRLWAAAKRGMTRLPAVPLGLEGRLAPYVPFLHHDPWNYREALLAGRFRFLNRDAELGWPPDWSAPGLPLLWRFNLHYFGFLHLLQPDEQVALWLDWARRHPQETGMAWHPFPISLRIVNGCKADVRHPEVLESLYRQAAFLHRNTESYLLGNHYLENARALVLAGCFFDGQGEALRWLAHGLRIYREQTPEQVLADGGHFERSPMYHALMLEGYLDVLNVLPVGHVDRPWLEGAAQRMAGFLCSVTRPDGKISLFNDAAHEIAPATADLLQYAETLLDRRATKRTSFPETGYYIHEDADVYLIIDGGPVGPDYLPAHAHADVFSYELSLRGLPFVVDSGVYEYAAGPVRAHMRSTKAHNTVGVDGVDQVECWGSFRVARRSTPLDVRFEQRDGASLFGGTFGGYAGLIGDGIVHRRSMSYRPDVRRLTVTDVAEGSGRHRVESRIHLHPDVRVSREGEDFALERAGIRCVFRADGAVALEEGQYAPEFGTLIKNKVLVLGGVCRLPVRMTYYVATEAPGS